MTFESGFCANPESEHIEWVHDHGDQIDWWDRKKALKNCLAEMWPYPQTEAKVPHLLPETMEGKFLRLAQEWSQNTKYISSVSDLINDGSYQEIIRLGWPAVPHLLNDLERNKRFWFPALAAITGVRPFDPIDASNYQRMTQAWLRWGKRKELI